MDKRWRYLVPIKPLSWWRSLLAAGACVAAASGLKATGGALFGVDLPFITFLPAVLVASVWGGFLGGGAATVASTVLAYLLFMPPHQSPAASVWSLVSFLFSAGLMVLVGGALTRVVAALTDSEARHRTLAEELSHRAKNGFAVMQTIISQTARGATTVEAFEALLLSRMQAMASAQELVSATADESADLTRLIPITLAPFDIDRFELEHADGEVVLHNRNLALTLALVLHELATNAVKYGALSNTEGRVSVRSEKRAGMMEIRWSEAGGPPVAEPTGVGFGTRLLQVGLGGYGGRGERILAPDGVVCTLSFPI